MLTTLNRGILSMQSSVFSFNLTPPPSGFPSSSSYFFFCCNHFTFSNIQRRHDYIRWLHFSISSTDGLLLRNCECELRIKSDEKGELFAISTISFHCCFPFVFILFFFLRFFFVFASSLVAFRLFFRSFLSCCAIIFLRIFLQKFH